MIPQKEATVRTFYRGDLVRIANDLGPMMEHFPGKGKRAIVLYSYADAYGSGKHSSLALYVEGTGEVAWYYDSQLTLIKEGQFELLAEWESTQRREIVQKSDLDWVFSNATEVLNHPHRASIQALARCFGLSDMWGPNGEGITYIYNAHYTLELARPFLEHANKEGWLQFAEKIRNARKEGT